MDWRSFDLFYPDEKKPLSRGFKNLCERGSWCDFASQHMYTYAERQNHETSLKIKFFISPCMSTA